MPFSATLVGSGGTATFRSPAGTKNGVRHAGRWRVPGGFRALISGFGATRDEEWTGDLPPDAPVVHVRAFAYKGLVETRTTPKR